MTAFAIGLFSTLSSLVSAAYAPFPAVAGTCSKVALNTLSCHNTTAVNTCCFNDPGGLILQTQFWDSLGPKDSWTIHGLWPDYCNGSYPEFCAPEREFFNITSVLTAARESSLLSYMNTYWKNVSGPDEDFWEHEFNKHGTCMSTLEPKCYAKYKPGMEVVDYLKQTVRMFKKLDTFKFLQRCGITPSNTKTYTLAAVEKCLTKASGAKPHMGCSTDGSINELWYYYYVRGKILGGKYEATESTYGSTCPAEGIKYAPKV